MRLYRRNNAWYVDCSYNGRRVRRKVGSSKKLAIMIGKEIENRLMAEYHGVHIEKEIRFDDLCAQYLEYSKTRTKPKTHRRYRDFVKHLLVAFSDRHIRDIAARDLEEYMTERKSTASNSTINKELACVKHMFNKAVEWGYLKHNQLAGVKRLKEPPGRLRYLTRNEEERLINACAGHLKPIVVTALNTGMRKGEILSLTWADVNMHNRIITIRKSKNNETRSIPMSDTLYETLKSQKSSTNGQNVFPGKNGDCLTEIKRSFATALRKAGIKDFRFHDLRHTFASRLVMSGVDIRTVQELMGHKDIRMTMRYSHLSNSHLKEAVKRLDNGTQRALEDVLHYQCSANPQKIKPASGFEPETCGLRNRCSAN